MTRPPPFRTQYCPFRSDEATLSNHAAELGRGRSAHPRGCARCVDSPRLAGGPENERRRRAQACRGPQMQQPVKTWRPSWQAWMLRGTRSHCISGKHSFRRPTQTCWRPADVSRSDQGCEDDDRARSSRYEPVRAGLTRRGRTQPSAFGLSSTPTSIGDIDGSQASRPRNPAGAVPPVRSRRNGVSFGAGAGGSVEAIPTTRTTGFAGGVLNVAQFASGAGVLDATYRGHLRYRGYRL